ncbi:uncharacterized protein [Lolium perenne]|uniref:uncharacterized protein n=1 Tax=Lolium perenne TaxID=4522 RepID=UPI003A99EA22
MESLTPEGRAIYDTLTAASAVQQEQRKRDIDALITKAVNTAVESVVRSSIDKAVSNMQLYADGVENTLQQHISELREQVGLAAHQDDPDQATRMLGGDADTGPEGRRATPATRRSVVGATGPYIPPPARGICQNRNSDHAPRSFDLRDEGADSPPRGRVPRVDFPKFDGENPQLWQIRCEDYFDLFDTSPHLWVKLASMQFTGPAARWLNSIKTSIRKFTWSEFCQEVLLRFGRNQHQCLIRRLYKLVQTRSVEEYVNQFAELVDQLATYENQPDPLHYVTRFLEGLKLAVRLLVAVQLPQDLDTAYTIALVQEEVGDGMTTLNSSVITTARRAPVTAPAYGRPLDDRSQTRSTEMSRTTDDKIAALRNYRRAKNPCFTCGEKYSREQKCQSTVQLHVVQEMVEFFQQPDTYQWEGVDSVTDMELMQLTDVSIIDLPPEQSIVLHCTVQGHPAVFLLDSSSNNSFVNASLATKLTGHVPLPTPHRVKVAGGEPEGLPPHRAVSHSIPLIEGARPGQIRPYRLAPELKNEVEKQIAEMLQSGVIRPSASNFASPLIMVKKKDQTWRPCIDFRHLNALTVKSKYPLPVINELLDELHGACWFSKLDLRAEYHQIRLTEGDEHKTAFHTHHGHYEFTVMAFGLTGAPATFQAEMNMTLAPDNQWKVKISKCSFAQPSIHYLGHVISASGVATDEAKIETVKEWPTPSLKKALIAAPVLALPDFSAVFVVETDACDTGIGAVLMQKDHPLAFVSKALGPRSKGLSTYEKEYMAILLAVQQWRAYLQHKEFIIRTDHASLTHLTDQRLHTPWQHKVLSKLMGMQYRIVYKKGLENKVADALSRRPHPELEIHAISCSPPAWILAVLDAYQQDAQAKALLQRLSIAKEPDDQFSLHGGIIRKQGRIWLPSNSAMQEQLILEFHASPMGGHSGIPVTLRRLKQLFVWKGMAASVHQFVKSCSVCQQAKADRSKYPGLLQPLPVPDSAFQCSHY